MLFGTIALAALLAIVGLIGVCLGVRGRRIDDHPLCRRCRFDLSGVAASAAFSLCPECGRSVADSSDRRVGNRCKRKGLLTTGALLLLVATAIGSTLAYAHARGMDWQKHKPIAWLRQEAKGTATSATEAWIEMTRRLDAGRLDRENLRWWIERALTQQADTGLAWNANWGEFIEAAFDRELLTEEDWNRYARQALVLSLEPRNPIQVGSAVPFTIVYDQRVGNRYRLGYEGVALAPMLDGVRSKTNIYPSRHILADAFPGAVLRTSLPQLTPSTHRNHVSADLNSSPDSLYYVKWPQAASPGQHELSVPVAVRIIERPKGSPLNALSSNPKVLTSYEVLLRAPVEARQADPIELVSTTELRDTFKKAVSLQDPVAFRSAGWGRLQVYAMVWFKPPPMDVAFDCFVRVNGQEYYFDSNGGPADNPTGQGFGYYGTIPHLILHDGAVVDVILRPSPDEARTHPTLTRIWGEEIVLKNVEYTAPTR